MSQAPTAHVESVDFVMLYIVGISVILLLGITATMIYFVFKYNRKKGHQPVDIEHNTALEITWIVIPTILVLSMFYFGYTSFRELRDIPKNSFKVNVTARMWEFSFKYENGKQTDTLYVPVKTPILLEMQSQDVNHAFYIPAFRIKEDVIANKNTYLSFTPNEIGDYDVACAEYCGLNHSAMYTKVKVLSKDKFEDWYKQK
ncbi:cytochrome c oxidase subunit II [Stygiobacter electus]|uniref:Cytochrome c oxidase subunit 2 n=1 Tax=Stygiobacter electus TaxID=3032292 RepID=A0AAE3P1K9_9BACT|nr:cytochrome c oxidase subunit II [Stygiobacter electus]MDF1612399.1 cytochrome c oxidase subunit II [Stygiobacter electus]